MSIFPKTPPKVKLMAALMAPSRALIEEALSALTPAYGEVDSSSCVFPFTYSGYYRDEMGEKLLKMFCSFSELVDPDEIVSVKLKAIACEKSLLREHTSRRLINIDPGYLDRMKLVLTTTKNASHRIYLGEGIYGDIELIYGSGSFVCLAWTYPDYKETFAVRFFNQVRELYLAQLRAATLDVNQGRGG